VLDLLSNLVDKSLVVADPVADHARRYRMLEPVRQYALQGLNAAGEANAVRQQHLTYFYKFGERAENHLHDSTQVIWAARVMAELDNIRSAIQWSLQATAETGLSLVTALTRYWWDWGDIDEGIQWFLTLLEQETLPRGAIRARALGPVARLMNASALNREKAQALAEEGVALARELRDRKALAFALYSLGGMRLSNPNVALPMLTESLALYQELGNPLGIAMLTLRLGQLAQMSQAGLAAARDYFEQSLQQSTELGDYVWIATARRHIGLVAGLQGDWTTAKFHFNEGINVLRRIGSWEWTAYALTRLAWAEMELGNLEHAHTILTEAAIIEQRVGVHAGVPSQARVFAAYLAWHQGLYERALHLYQWELDVLQVRGPMTNYIVELLVALARLDVQMANYSAAAYRLIEVFQTNVDPLMPIHLFQSILATAMLAVQLGEDDTATTLLGAADMALNRTGWTEVRLDRSDRENTVRVAQKRLGNAAFDLAFTRGQTLSVEQAVEYIREWLVGHG
jgi:tetratricopeptide (TPR) repeat protein